MSNLTLGKGKLYFDAFAPGTTNPSGGERFLGNCPEFNMSVERETLEHYDSTEGINQKDDEVDTSITYSATLTCDEISKENLAIFFLGSASVITEAGSTGNSDTFNNSVPGNRYQLGTSASNPSGVRKVTNVVVKDDAGTPTTFALGDDYEVDLDRGAVTVKVGGAITEGTNLVIDYDVTAHSRDLVISEGATVEGTMRFIATNPKGAKRDYFMPRVKLTSSGDIALIGESWQQLSLGVEVLKKTGLAELYLDDQPVV